MVFATDVSLATNAINYLLVSGPLPIYVVLAIPMTRWLEELKDVCTNIQSNQGVVKPMVVVGIHV